LEIYVAWFDAEQQTTPTVAEAEDTRLDAPMQLAATGIRVVIGTNLDLRHSDDGSGGLAPGGV
jgi:hypothetical protein